MKLNDGPFLRAQMAIPDRGCRSSAALASVALILAGIGIYGVTSYVAVDARVKSGFGWPSARRPAMCND